MSIVGGQGVASLAGWIIPKYPGSPDTQKAIASQRSGMEAKKAAYATTATMRADWDQVRITAMAWTLTAKLRQHPDRFGAALLDTGQLPVVEMSHKDPFWGARLGTRRMERARQHIDNPAALQDDPQVAQDAEMLYLAIAVGLSTPSPSTPARRPFPSTRSKG